MAWLAPLTYELRLADGRVLRTLHDVRDVLTSGAFEGVRHSPPLEHAIDLLLAAAETGSADAIKAATDQVAIVLRQRWLMP